MVRSGVAKIAFGVAWIGTQAALILTAPKRPDAAFGFQMFSESSTISVHLTRAVDAPKAGKSGRTVVVPVEAGTWSARTPAGTPHEFHWHDLVHAPELGVFDRQIHASYSAAAQIARWQAAADYVVSHIQEDTDTRAIVLDITVWRNGHEPYTVHYVAERYLWDPRNG